MWWLLLGFFWLFCILLNYGMLLARDDAENKEWDKIFKSKSYVNRRRKDMGDCLFFALMIGILAGPLSPLIVFLITGFAEHGLKWRL